MALDEQEKIEVQDLISQAELAQTNHRHKGTGNNESPRVSHSDLTDLLLNTHTQYALDVTAKAGEAITIRDSLFIGDGVTVMDHEKNKTSNTDAQFGDNTASSKLGQSFQSSIAIDCDKATIRIRKIGAPTDNVKVSLQADSSGDPSGTALQTVNLDGSTLTTSYQNKEFTFPATQALDASTTYWLVVERSGAADASNYYECEYQNTNVYSSGQLKNKDDVTGDWETTDYGATSDLYFKISLLSVLDSAYLTRLSNQEETNLYIGFAKSTEAKGSTVTIQRSSLVTGFTGLTSATRHYLTNTKGSIGTTVGDFIKVVGIGVGTTELLLIVSESASVAPTAALTVGEDVAQGDTASVFGEVEEETLAILADQATRVDEQNATTNYDGSALNISNSTAAGGSYERALISFDSMPAIPSGSGINVTKIEVKVHLFEEDNGSSSADPNVLPNSASFDETTVVWNDKPATTASIGTLPLYSNANAYVDIGYIEVTETQYNNIKNNGVSVIDETEGGGAYNTAEYSDDDGNNTANKPKIDVKFTVEKNDGKAYKGSAATANQADGYIGFFQTAANSGESAVVQGVGFMVDVLSGLTIGELYYLSDTDGAIATSAGSQNKVVGVAITATKLLILNYKE
tara:strand:+ start:6241 stop:8133 length:1893 start_codon:yes stop_codon:yes gene_type:complete